jgi:hypothetical protein
LERDVLLVYFTVENSCRHCLQEEVMLADLASLSDKVELEVLEFRREPEAAEKAARQRAGKRMRKGRERGKQ